MPFFWPIRASFCDHNSMAANDAKGRRFRQLQRYELGRDRAGYSQVPPFEDVDERRFGIAAV